MSNKQVLSMLLLCYVVIFICIYKEICTLNQMATPIVTITIPVIMYTIEVITEKKTKRNP